jgi:type IV pilus assembly protein PilX
MVSGPVSHSKQSGFSLFVALVTLLVMSIIAVGMVAMMRAGTNAASNIAFRQASLRVGDAGISAARAWLLNTVNTTPLTLNADSPGNGYYAYLTYNANGTETFSPASFNWESGGFQYLDPNATASTNQLFPGAYQVYYVIHRMARPTQLATAIQQGGSCSMSSVGCASPPTPTGGVSGQGQSQSVGSSYNPGLQGPVAQAYYRVTVRVTGPMRNVSYVQAFMY